VLIAEVRAADSRRRRGNIAGAIGGLRQRNKGQVAGGTKVMSAALR